MAIPITDRDFLKKRLRNVLAEKKITPPELTSMTGINYFTIKNILHGKSAEESHLKAIATALNINYRYLTTKECNQKNLNIDPNIYLKCTDIAVRATNKANIKVTTDKIKLLQDALYFGHTEQGIPLEQGEAFILGIIHYGLSLGTFIKNT